MIVAKQKRKENVSEYVLYMWQIEDTLRALELNDDAIREYVTHNYQVDSTQLEDIIQWYFEMAEEMRSRELLREGHLRRVEEVMELMTMVHRKLLKLPSQALYSALYYKTLPTIIQLRSMGGDDVKGEIETCFVGVYGYLTLKLKGEKVSEETLQAVKQVSTYLAMLADRVREYEEGRLPLEVKDPTQHQD